MSRPESTLNATWGEKFLTIKSLGTDGANPKPSGVGRGREREGLCV